MKENKGKVFLVIIIILVILGLQPGIRENVVHFFTKTDIWSQLGFDKSQRENISDNFQKKVKETVVK